ncbi:MAG TPA: tRNA 2-selenouridine(34) synthase MnmH [Gammaproteobacteria bacterium]|nr:tRNA 2-selenouridine(34) synthase MnmH [Gammaproteobacteria bacterium]HBY00589.1 tRNA 2-selenouridine(34) synthase MnmH [Gammaproteobacteria bacterium]|tara:strand:+ start:591 stop:1691 length:1101 start_codon:yes stop_codon:yes gene_type:complete
MPEIISKSGFANLFIGDIPLLDVRSPKEFNRGSFPNATNLPLLTDDERAAVGIRYKKAGPKAAISLGYELINVGKKQTLLEHWQTYLDKNPNALLYCFRGGLRSEIVQQWLIESGTPITRIEGGYKAMRRFLINIIETVTVQKNIVVLAGKAGSGKTHLINQLRYGIDLEGCARHRGSAFGRRINLQPTPINFENSLSIQFLKLPFKRMKTLFLEDESRAIGAVSIPVSLFKVMKEAPLAFIEESLDNRVEIILNDYVISNYLEYKQSAPKEAEERFTKFLLTSLEKIRRRLGDEYYNDVREIMQKALACKNKEEAHGLHRKWIRNLLETYYDPMYEYQLSKKMHRLIFRGEKCEFLNWAKEIEEG